MTHPHAEHVRPNPLRPLPVGAVSSPGAAIDWGDWYLAGWSFRETTGTAAAAFDLIDGGDANGVIIASVTLQPNESIRDDVGGHMLTVRSGLFIAVTAGTVRGAVWIADRTLNRGR